MELFPVLIHGYAIGFQRKPMYTVFKLENSHMVSFICESEITSATRKRRRHCYSTAIPYSLWLRRIDRLLCPRPHRTEALSDVARLTSVWHLSVCLSRTSGLSRGQRGLGRIKLARGSPCHTWIGHHFQGQKVKGQLVVDVLNSQHAGTGAAWRINTNILSTCRGRRHIVAASRTACLLRQNDSTYKHTCIQFKRPRIA